VRGFVQVQEHLMRLSAVWLVVCC